MRNRHGPDADIRSGSVRNARCGCTSTTRFPTLQRFMRPPHTSMPTHIKSESDLDDALAALRGSDTRFAALIATAGRPPLRRRPDGFAGLATTIVSQQLSTASASAIWGRLAAAFDPFEPAAILRARAPRLAKAGLSSPKIRTLKEIARAIAHGELPLPALAD